MPKLVVSNPARRDIKDVLVWSIERFGDRAAERYRDLIAKAIELVAAEPDRSGSRKRSDLPGDYRLYHLRNCAELARTETGVVKEPRHFVVYRPLSGGGSEIVRVLHDSMDLKRHVEE